MIPRIQIDKKLTSEIIHKVFVAKSTEMTRVTLTHVSSKVDAGTTSAILEFIDYKMFQLTVFIRTTIEPIIFSRMLSCFEHTFIL